MIVITISVYSKSVKLEQKINKHPNSLKTKLANSVKLVSLLPTLMIRSFGLGAAIETAKVVVAHVNTLK